MINIRQNLTFRELASASLYSVFRLKILRGFFLFLTSLFVLSEVFAFAAGGNITVGDILRTVATLAMTFLLIIGLLLMSCAFFYKARYNDWTNTYYEINANGIIRHGGSLPFSAPWRTISRINETKAFFILYVGGYDFHVLQKKMFADAAELNAFRELLRQYAPNYKGR